MYSINKKNIIILLTAVFIFTLLFMLFQLYDSVRKEFQASQKILVQEAKAHFNTLLVMRRWNSNMGGVYVKQRNNMQANKYLKEPLLYTDKHEVFIHINPAWMTRQISEIANKTSDYHYKITSLKPINPLNAPDAFEREALEYFERHPDEKYFYKRDLSQNRFNLMGSLKVEPSCLSCHADQGYRLGDIRGGIKVSIPTKLHREKSAQIINRATQIALTIIILSILIYFILYRAIELVYKRQKEVEDLNETLEIKVIERTHSLDNLLMHESYLKGIFKMIADINELLISSFSVDSIIKNAAQRLNKHDDYGLVWIGLFEDVHLTLSFESQSPCLLLEDRPLYNINGQERAFSCACAQKAIAQRALAIEKVPSTEAEEREFKWHIAIPLLDNDPNISMGVLCLYNRRTDGFETEEINILKNLATDISMALNALKQQTAIAEMEQAKISNYEETILAFVNIIEQRDSYTAGHTLRVARYCRLIAKQMELKEDEILRLERAAILHDIGKVATPDSILLKPGELNRLEYVLIQQHALAGYDMLSKIDMYKDLAEIIKYHHSRYDGKGYPETQTPEEIPFLSSIMVVADAFDAMTTDRVYRAHKELKEALYEIERYSGSQFHPEIAKAAILALKDVDIQIVTQVPHTELEEQRFAYFFKDSLTKLYNEDYLKAIFANPDREYEDFYLIRLKDFASYNRSFGWEQGDMFLESFAQGLSKHYPQASIFRFHGDHFMLLFSEPTAVDEKVINSIESIKESAVHAQLTHHKFKRGKHDLSRL